MAKNDMVWTDDVIDRLRLLWTEGHSTAEIGRRMGTTKNAIVGKAARIDLPSRGSPIKYTSNTARRVHRSAKPLPPGAITVPLLISEVVYLAPKMESAMTIPVRKIAPTLKAIETKRVAGPSIFDNRAYRAPVIAPPKAFVPPSRKCCFPLWDDNAKPDHRYCDEPAVLRSYCGKHAKACYVVVRPFKDAA